MEIPSMLVQIAPTNSTNTFCIYSKVHITYSFSVKFVWVKTKKILSNALVGMGVKTFEREKIVQSKFTVFIFYCFSSKR